MKIIGLTENGFLLDADRDEVARLIGYYYAGERACPLLKVGTEINLNGMYEQLLTMASMPGELLRAATLLRKHADDLELVEPIVKVATETGGDARITLVDEVRDEKTGEPV